jgi:ParB-like chromosome segregation protein Spo0J
MTMSMPIRDLKVTVVPVASLKPYEQNPRGHTRRQIRQIAHSIKTYGWTIPILIDDKCNVIAGHGRLQAAKLLATEEVPVLRVSDMTDAQKRAYMIADNKLAEKSRWDEDLLRQTFDQLLELDPGFAITDTGFEVGEIDLLLSGSDDADDNPPPKADAASPIVTRPGDLWRLGSHRLLCADVTEPTALQQLMRGELAQVVFTDAPNVPAAHVPGKPASSEFAPGAGENSEHQSISLLKQVLGYLAAHSEDGAISFISTEPRGLLEIVAAGRCIYDELINICVRNPPGGTGAESLLRSQAELIVVFKTRRRLNKADSRQARGDRRDPSPSSQDDGATGQRDDRAAPRPAAKPVALLKQTIMDCSKRGGIVLDVSAGSGTTLIAAERTGRRGFGVERDPRQVDAVLRRFRRLTGVEPQDDQTRATFADREAIAASDAARSAATETRGGHCGGIVR